jgi:ABC-type uncharacterized transport system permease subunit
VGPARPADDPRRRVNFVLQLVQSLLALAAGLAAGLCALFLALSRWFWRWGLRRYSGASA